MIGLFILVEVKDFHAVRFLNSRGEHCVCIYIIIIDNNDTAFVSGAVLGTHLKRRVVVMYATSCAWTTGVRDDSAMLDGKAKVDFGRCCMESITSEVKGGRKTYESQPFIQ